MFTPNPERERREPPLPPKPEELVTCGVCGHSFYLEERADTPLCDDCMELAFEHAERVGSA